VNEINTTPKPFEQLELHFLKNPIKEITQKYDAKNHYPEK
jgi:hypothetical protein